MARTLVHPCELLSMPSAARFLSVAPSMLQRACAVRLFACSVFYALKQACKQRTAITIPCACGCVAGQRQPHLWCSRPQQQPLLLQSSPPWLARHRQVRFAYHGGAMQGHSWPAELHRCHTCVARQTGYAGLQALCEGRDCAVHSSMTVRPRCAYLKRQISFWAGVNAN